MTPLEARLLLLESYAAALVKVAPRTAVRDALARDGRALIVGGERIEAPGGVRIAALGKAAVGMASGALEVLGDLVVDGVVVGPEPATVPSPLRMYVGEHPRPGAGSVVAGRELLDLAALAGRDEVVLALVSGGGSSLAEATLGITAPALGRLIDDLMVAGAPIADLNVVRRHLSLIKNGGLARAAAPAEVISLIISDVHDGPPSQVASGPTMADSTSPLDAISVIRAHLGAVDEEVVQVLEARQAVSAPAGISRVVAGSHLAGAAAAGVLGRWGQRIRISETGLSGEASTTAVRLVREAGSGFTVFVGETTVTGANGGSGGRNQEAALAVAADIAGRDDVVFGAFATDGIDGPTDAAGAIVDGSTLSRGPKHALAALADHNSNVFLDAAGDLVRTGPTGTNVGDLWVVWKAGSNSRF